MQNRIRLFGASLLLLCAFCSPLKAQQVMWEAQEGHSYPSGPTPAIIDRIVSVLAFDTMVVAIGTGYENDSLGVVRIYSYVYGYSLDGRKLWEQRLSEIALSNLNAVKLTDTSWALNYSYPYSSTNPILGQQNGGIGLQVYNIKMQELWRWSFYENLPYSIFSALLPPRPGGKVLLSTYRYDTLVQNNISEVRTFTPEGFIEKVTVSDPYTNDAWLLSPMPDGNWISFDANYSPPLGATLFTVIQLDSLFHPLRTDTMATYGNPYSGDTRLIPCSDGGYQLFWTATLPISGNDTSFIHIERHDVLGGLVWQRTVLRSTYRPQTIKPLLDGGWLWVRFTNKSQSTDSLRIYFERMNIDGNTVWSVEMPTFASTGQRSGYSFLTIAFDKQGGGYVGGSTKPTGSSTEQYAYVRKVENLGLPYDPLASRPSIVSVRGQLSAYPNPSSSVTHIQGMAGRQAQLYSVQGALISTIRLDGQGRGSVDVSSLPRGMYLLRSQERSVRVVKE